MACPNLHDPHVKTTSDSFINWIIYTFIQFLTEKSYILFPTQLCIMYDSIIGKGSCRDWHWGMKRVFLLSAGCTFLRTAGFHLYQYFVSKKKTPLGMFPWKAVTQHAMLLILCCWAVIVLLLHTYSQHPCFCMLNTLYYCVSLYLNNRKFSNCFFTPITSHCITSANGYIGWAFRLPRHTFTSISPALFSLNMFA